jgi:hypothetical protein
LEGTSLSLPKTPHILVRRPSGLVLAPSPCLTEDFRAQSKSTAEQQSSRAAQQQSKLGCFGFGFGFGFALLLIFSAFKASRAPELETAEEARVFERSEFPRRAVSSEEHRAPMRSIGECPALAVLLPFAKTKGSRAAKRRESFASQ